MRDIFLTIKSPRRVKGDPIIYVCCPYADDRVTTAKKAGRYCRYVWEQGGIPMAPQLLFPQMDEANQSVVGMRRASKLLCICDEIWVFGDHISAGMAAEIAEAARHYIPVYHMDDASTLLVEAKEAQRCKP